MLTMLEACLAGPTDDIPIDKDAQFLDYEVGATRVSLG